jgi:uncharacterized phosphosugar-binding protein
VTEGARLAAPALAAIEAEDAALAAVAEAVARRIAVGGRLLTFGAGHSQSLAAELCSRAGGLRAVTSMSLEDLRDTPRAAHEQYADSAPERVPANGVALLDRYAVTAADALLVISQSGRNGAPVEMARVARARGVFTAGLLSRAHCAAVGSRHPDGLKLVDTVDVVIDNHCPVGDAVIATPDGTVSAASTIAGALLLQMLNARVIAALRERGAAVAVIRSANVEG